MGMLESLGPPMGPKAPSTSGDTLCKLRAHCQALDGTYPPLKAPISDVGSALGAAFCVVLSKGRFGMDTGPQGQWQLQGTGPPPRPSALGTATRAIRTTPHGAYQCHAPRDKPPLGPSHPPMAI